MKKILVTGAYGYIGSHTVKRLAEAGYQVSGMDNKISNNKISKYLAEEFDYYDFDVSDHSHSHRWFDCVVHLAASISVEESVSNPWKYFKNNVIGTKNIFQYYPSENFIFSSTATAFDPVSPYAQSKLMAESIIRASSKNHTIFRFFNVAGSNGEFVQIGKPTHLIRIAAEVAAGKRTEITINGTDWPTIDGTCVRDYIHVSDVVDCILHSIEHPSNNDFDCLGSGSGYSVKQVIDTMKKVTGVNFNVIEGPRRPGDAAEILIPEGISNYCNPKFTLEDMCLSAYHAELRRVG